MEAEGKFREKKLFEAELRKITLKWPFCTQ
jgi:hypothetical protein